MSSSQNIFGQKHNNSPENSISEKIESVNITSTNVSVDYQNEVSEIREDVKEEKTQSKVCLIL